MQPGRKHHVTAMLNTLENVHETWAGQAAGIHAAFQHELQDSPYDQICADKLQAHQVM